MPKFKHALVKRSPMDMFAQVIIYILVGSFALITLLPFVYIFAGSFATDRELIERPFFLFPKTISFNAYKYIFDNGDIFRGLRNSLIVTVVGTTINMFFSTTLAYPLSRPYFKGKKFIFAMVLVSLLFTAGMVPNYLLVANILRLRNTYWSLWLPGAINMFNMLIIMNYFRSLPQEMEESAYMDGANDLQIFTRIMLPLSAPALASVSLFYAVSHWNSYFGAMMYISDRRWEVVQIMLRRIIFLTQSISSETGIDWGLLGEPPEKSIRLATTVFAVIPILLVYPFIQKYFTQGVMVGSIKG
ncbi:MAG: carbohydrate ABC transporter permease [Sphaerochaeta sp.]|jgi:putative aldouronate transport system permease protein|nr:carbohydrate ABC transporter permease [Sphaerochaeta sp.]MDX9914451.1 carbohydrate ABC transporter permease [Sphaerochaeta sp.]